MQGKKERHQPKLFYHVAWEKLVPSNHLLRRIHKILDLGFVRELTKALYCENNGRPSVDPEVYFRMQLLLVLFGIPSERQLCEEVQVNLAYRWFLGLSLEDEVPDHSALGKIRQRLGEETFKVVFDNVVRQCQEKGFLKGKHFFADSSLIQANASIDSLVKRDQGKGSSKSANETHISSTDPDSTLTGRPGVANRLYYQAHEIIDASSRVVTDVHLTPSNVHESTVLVDRLLHQKRQFSFPTESITADRGYGRGPVYERLQKERIRAYIPPHLKDMGETHDFFFYDNRNDYYVCPEGHKLFPSGKPNPRNFQRYKIEGKPCGTCPWQNLCFAGRALSDRRHFFRSPYQKLYEQIQKRKLTHYFKSRLKERRWKMEGIFAEAKNNHGLRRAKQRGRWKVQVQLYLTAWVQNLKRLASLLHERLPSFNRIWVYLCYPMHPNNPAFSTRP